MSRIPDAVYGGFDIFTVIVPGDHGGWSAIADVERAGADGVEVFQDFGGPCEGQTAEQAKAKVLDNTRRKIDDLKADPV
ncbi:hypothetical protein [Oxalicibacterium faecigallinarum]|uniref:Uncharacterized protein n=1 Tax=Oxalicibacterium faecigallinarum TaxID=573741 RepID=A0A8J3F035_9BURK|nr:hypothetical protein [Oxalicibacterium faecigallinarum]GGI15922.1 hypothetical protein GCM10008066_01380 [Oxalicibacterium faecigallinarum]